MSDDDIVLQLLNVESAYGPIKAIRGVSLKVRQGEIVTVEDILAFLEPKLSKIEMPSEIEFRDELPKTMVGKLSKKELRAEVK